MHVLKHEYRANELHVKGFLDALDGVQTIILRNPPSTSTSLGVDEHVAMLLSFIKPGRLRVWLVWEKNQLFAASW